MSETSIEARVSRVEAEQDVIHERLSTQSNRIGEVEKNHSISEVVMSVIDTRLGSIEDTLKWIVRLIVGAIILALIGLLITGTAG